VWTHNCRPSYDVAISCEKIDCWNSVRLYCNLFDRRVAGRKLGGRGALHNSRGNYVFLVSDRLARWRHTPTVLWMSRDVVDMSADGPLLCNGHAVTSLNREWWSRDVRFPWSVPRLYNESRESSGEELQGEVVSWRSDLRLGAQWNKRSAYEDRACEMEDYVCCSAVILRVCDLVRLV
jgi:hypothetical protein